MAGSTYLNKYKKKKEVEDEVVRTFVTQGEEPLFYLMLALFFWSKFNLKISCEKRYDSSFSHLPKVLLQETCGL